MELSASHILGWLWLCLFLFGMISCFASFRDLCKRGSNSLASLQMALTMAAVLPTVSCLHRAIYPLASRRETVREMVFTLAVSVLLWGALGVRAFARRRGKMQKNQKHSRWFRCVLRPAYYPFAPAIVPRPQRQADMPPKSSQ